MRRAALLFALSFIASYSVAGQDSLIDGFKNPPNSAKPHTWWHWMNGNVSKEGITADLEAMKKVGLGGAQMFAVDVGLPAGKVGYMSQDWRAMITHAVKEANRLGLELCIHNCAGWSSSGGPWITPDHAMQVLAWSEIKVQGPKHVDETLPPIKAPQVYAHVDYQKDIAVYAFPTPQGETADTLKQRWDQNSWLGRSGVERQDGVKPMLTGNMGTAIPLDGIINITDKLDASGHLNWDAPAGDWTILRMGYTPTGKDNHPAPVEGRGLEVDKLSREALDAHWAGMMAKIIKDVGPLAGKSLKDVLIDSYEVGSQNWTPKMREEFKRLRGYDPLPYLPTIAGHLVVDAKTTDRFLWDLRRTIADLYTENYYGYFADLCHKQGMIFSTEPYGNGGFDNMAAGGTADIVMGEFWVGGGAVETTKLASSIGHTYGQKIVGAESFTADDRVGRFKVEPYGIKALGDQMFCNGINRYIFHRYAHQPWMGLYPGMTMGPWGTHFERTVTWWDESPAWLKYVARCQYMLQSGRFVADVAYYTGQDAPTDLPFRPSLNPKIPDGYDYDGVDTKVLLTKMHVKDHNLVLDDGMTYRMLVLPDSPLMTPEVAKKIKELVAAGATVIGPKPTHSPSLQNFPACDNEVTQIADEVWGEGEGEHKYGQGKVIWSSTPDQLLASELSGERIQPDFANNTPGTQLMYIHRLVGGTNAYFVSNQHYSPATVDCSFRVTGKTPQLWHPDTGSLEDAPIFSEQGGMTHVSLPLDAAGSVFVVFDKDSPVNHLRSMTHLGTPGESHIPVIVISHASYERADGQPGSADVTAKVAAMVASGNYSISATNGNFGDPAYNFIKQLKIEYTIDGKPMTKTIAENDTLELVGPGNDGAMPDFEVRRNKNGSLEVLPWERGSYRGEMSNDKPVGFIVPTNCIQTPVGGKWTVKFQPDRGAPPSIELDQLGSLTDNSDPGVKYFSGTAEYTKTLQVTPEQLGNGNVVLLDLGKVKNMAHVWVNRHDFGIIWKAPFRIDVTGILKAGPNELKIQVTDLWVNRLIGDEQLPPEVEWNQGGAIKAWPQWLIDGKPRPKSDRVTFTTWHFYDKNSPLLESGLIGPVVIRSVKPVVLK